MLILAIKNIFLKKDQNTHDFRFFFFKKKKKKTVLEVEILYKSQGYKRHITFKI